MKGVARFKDYKKGCTLLTAIPINIPPPEHVQIKVMASPINPCDEYFCCGKYAPHGKTEPFICGYEGAGIITAIGENVPGNFTGKRVAFYKALKYTDDTVGVWCQFATLHYSTCVLLDDSMSFEDACGLLINPLTAFGFLEIIKRESHKTIVNTAAASALGRMLIKVCKKESIEIISIVRRKEQVTLLQSLGATYVLNQSNPDFEEEFKKLATKLECRLAFDAIGGDVTAKLLSGMPSKSTVYMYGQLGGDYKCLHPCHFMQGDKTLKGFVLSSAEVYKDKEKLKEAVEYIVEDIKSGGTAFKTTVAKRYRLEEFEEALTEYKKFATDGKAVFCPNS